ncbi:MAG: hypothetical protein COC05_01465 [Gammaproteobacteria bacterium]|nr:MAG: hypothetical protein COC05_01465 [Gammaproteobacteria bacterium]
MLIRYSLLCFVVASPLAMAVQFEEGEWQTEVRIEFNGAMFPVPFTTERCLSPQDPIPNTTANNANCKISDVSDTDSELGWTLHCDDAKGSLHGVGGITFKGNGFTGTMKMEIRDDEGELQNQHRYHMTGFRKGPCKE